MRFNILLAVGGIVPIATGAIATGQTCQPYWASLSRLQLSGPAITYGLFDDGAGPTVYAAKGNPVLYHRWRNGQWETLPTEGLPPGRTTAYTALFAMDDGTGPALYSFIHTSPTTTGSVRWKDGAWTLMPIAFWQNDLGGRAQPFTSADLGGGMRIYGKLPTGRICRWNGQSWDQFGQAAGSSQALDGMIGYDDGHGTALYVFGQFQSIDGVAARNFAKWDGQNWTAPWPEGVSGYSGRPLMTIFDNGDGPKLYSDYMPPINGQSRIGLHRWDGTTWEFLGGPNTQIPEFHGLHAFNDGSGPSLIITGLFSNFAGLPARNMVRYDAQGFHTIPGSELWGLTEGIGAIRDARGESFAFSSGYHPPQYYATVGQWVGCPSCPADCNADGRLNVLDFMCFLNGYAAFDPFANTQADGFFNVQDFAAFMNRFAAGCP